MISGMAEGIIEPIVIHFDVPGNGISLDAFIKTANSANAIIKSFNHELFAERLSYQLVVLPSSDGSFKNRLGVCLLAVGGVFWTTVESDVGKALIKGLTSHEPSYWAEKAGSELRMRFADLESDVGKGASGRSETEECRFAASIIAEMTKSFLQKTTSELESIGIPKEKIPSAYAARNSFYEACIAVPDLRAIGFSEDPVFPVDRRDFVRLQVLLRPEDSELEENWFVSIVDLHVTSPNWSREDYRRYWKAKDNAGRDRYFRIDDPVFWRAVKNNDLTPSIITKMRVQWAFRGSESQPRDIRVLKVLDFNQRHLSEPLDDVALSEILGRYRAESSGRQANLFDD